MREREWRQLVDASTLPCPALPAAAAEFCQSTQIGFLLQFKDPLDRKRSKDLSQPFATVCCEVISSFVCCFSETGIRRSAEGKVMLKRNPNICSICKVTGCK